MTMRFALLVHGHQPPGNFDSVFREATARSYAPFFEELARHPTVRISVHLSGSLLLWLERNEPALIARLRELVARGQVEPVAAGLHEPILALLPAHDRAAQIAAHRAYVGRLLGREPHIGWLTERVWEPSLAADLAQAGITAIPLDDRHFLAAGLAAEELSGAFLTEHQGQTLTVVPSPENVRHALPFESVGKALAILKDEAARGVELLTFADDLEKFGLWPGTHRTVYERGWLRRFFEGLERLAPAVEAVPLGEALEALPATRRVYLPGGSYPEMMRWSLPPAAQRRLGALEGALDRAGLREQADPFLHAGVYFQYLAKYPEANHLHKRMLDVSRRVAAWEQRAGPRPPARLASAREALWRAQANCVYWHGWFGGTYLPHLRQAAYRQLLTAERALEAGGERAPALRVTDLDADGREEALLANAALSAVVAPADGGSVVELSDRKRLVSLVDTLARRPEAYHDPAQPPPYDRGRRGLFVDRLLPPGPPPGRRAEVVDAGDFAGRPYAMSTQRTKEGTVVTLTREASAAPLGDGRLRIEKRLVLPPRGGTLRARYTVRALGAPLSARLGVELNLGIFFAQASQGSILLGGSAHALARGGAARGGDAITVALADPALRVTATSSLPADLDARPVETVSQWEGGFERIRQCLACLFSWPLELAAGERFEVEISLRVDGGAA